MFKFSFRQGGKGVPALFVTGCGRSGTSMAAGLFGKSNRFMGDNLHPRRETNPAGFFESPQINSINERILLPYLPKDYAHGSVAYGKDAPRRTHTWLARIGTDVNVAAKELERLHIADLTKRTPFCFKDTRFCYTIHEWIPLIERTTR